jgi:malonyl CoA-acyl carrier protein transacylase
MAVQHKIFPPTIKIKKPDPKLKLEESPFYLNTRKRPWIKYNDYPRRASISSFGFGGTNFHATIEEYNGPGKSAYRQRIVPDELILFSADDPGKLINTCKESTAKLDIEGVLSFLARKTQENFDVKRNCRLAIIASGGKDLEQKIHQAADIILKKPDEDFSTPNGIFYSAKNLKPGPIAFLFPGQGSQYIDMGADLYLHFKEFQELWDDVNGILKKQELNLAEIVFPKPVFSEEESKKLSDTLTRTEWAQPAICATSIGMSRILKTLGIKPALTGGHSLGEITALHEAGVMDLDGVIRTTRRRGELMAQSSSVPGSMTAVTEPAEKIEKLLKEWKSRVIIANYNSPKQIVLSGAATDIEDIEKRLAKENIKTHRLNVATAFHSSLMNDACLPFADFLKKITIKSPCIPIYSNAEVNSYPDTPDDIRKLLAKQLNNSVRFVEEIEAMYKSGARIFIEVGPGNVITNLVKKILADKPHKAINLDTKN